MSKDTWDLIKKHKNFHVSIYRRGLKFLIGSLLLSVIFSILIIKFYSKQPERDYYATSGVTAPVELTVLFAPNMTSHALLPPDFATNDEPKAIPQ